MPNDDDRPGDPGAPLRARRSRLHAWLELVRLPNLLTVPGDPIAGFLLAGAAGTEVAFVRVVPCAAASLFLYMAGTVSNDCFDLEEDLRDRPGRPLPSRRVHPGAALLVAVLLFALGVASAVLAGVVPAMVACLLTLAVVTYNAGGKRITLWGPLNMGLCRGLSLMLGAAALGVTGLTSTIVLVAAGGLTLYVAAVTLIAAKETSGKAVGTFTALLPSITMIPWMWAIILAAPRFSVARGTWMWAAFLGSLLASTFVRGQTEPARISRGIGAFITILVLMQAGLIALAPGEYSWLVSWSVFALCPLSLWLGRKFYAS